jgi:hypothetical protein
MDLASSPLQSCVDGMKDLAHSLRGECQPPFAPPRARTGFAPRSSRYRDLLEQAGIIVVDILNAPSRPSDAPQRGGRPTRRDVPGQGTTSRRSGPTYICVWDPPKIPPDGTRTDSAPPCFFAAPFPGGRTSSAMQGAGTREPLGALRVEETIHQNGTRFGMAPVAFSPTSVNQKRSVSPLRYRRSLEATMPPAA